MSDTDTQTTSTKAPTHIAYHVREGNGKGFFTRIGAAWPHKDGKGFNISLESMPKDGKITIRVPSKKKQ